MIEVIVIVLGAVLAFGGWRLNQMNSQLGQVKLQLASKESKIAELSQSLLNKERQIADKQQDIDNKDQQIVAKEAQIAQLNQSIEEQQNTMRYKQALSLTLANAAYDALLVVNQNFNVIGINTSAEELFNGVGAVGKPLLDVTHVPELKMMVDDALTNHEASFEEQMLICGKNYRVRAQVIHRDGHLFVGLALQDVTHLVKLNRARRDMVANISHELRTPIANIRITIDSLFHDQEKPKRKDSISSLRAIARETDNLLWLVQEMSDLSMIESGQAIVKLVDVSLADLIDELIERMRDLSETKNIQIVRDMPEDLDALCDRDLAQRVIVNLIHNAIKWSPSGEPITVSTVNGGDEITVSILDNGPGVPENAVERIFERFYQVDASRSGGEGTGLGLAICRHIVEAHGGRIWAESNKDGSGGRFLFTLLSAGEHVREEVEE